MSRCAYQGQRHLYQTTRTLGAGSYGTVVAAEARPAGHAPGARILEVALKIPASGSRHDAEDEAAILQGPGCVHEGIVRLLEIIESPKRSHY